MCDKTLPYSHRCSSFCGSPCECPRGCSITALGEVDMLIRPHPGTITARSQESENPSPRNEPPRVRGGTGGTVVATCAHFPYHSRAIAARGPGTSPKLSGCYSYCYVLAVFRLDIGRVRISRWPGTLCIIGSILVFCLDLFAAPTYGQVALRLIGMKKKRSSEREGFQECEGGVGGGKRAMR